MTTTPMIRNHHSFAARFAMISTVSLGLLAGPIAMAAPATASNDHSRKADCTVTALDPYAKDHGRNTMSRDNRKDRDVRVAFAFKIRCDKDTDVRYNQKMFQVHDRYDTEKIGDAWDTVSVSGHHDKIVNVERVTADRGDRFVEVYHNVRIRVEDKGHHGGHGNRSSDFDESNTVKIWVNNNHR
jgi:hypothetical protein